MAIKGYSERLRLPRKGIIRIGEKTIAKNGKEYPKALDHFAGPEEIHKFFGEKPKEIPIMFPFDEVEMNYDETLKAYKSGGKLFCKGNGEIASRSDGKGGIIELDCPFQECSYFQKKECKPIGVLTFLIPELSMTGAYQIWTSSRYSMDNLRATLFQLRKMFGKLSNIPMSIKVRMEKAHPWVTSKTGELKQMTTEVPILSVECNLPLEKVQRLAARKDLRYIPDTELSNDKSLDKGDTLFITSKIGDNYSGDVPEGNIIDDEKIECKEELKPGEPPSWNELEEPKLKFHPVVEKYLGYDDILKRLHNIDSAEKYMSITDKNTGELRHPSIDQIKKWGSDKEIAFLSNAINKMEAEYQELRKGVV